MINKKKTTKVFALFIVVLMIFFSFPYLAFAEAGQEKDTTYLEEQMDFMSRLIQFIEANYSDDITYEELINSAYEGLFDALDPYSTYFPSDDYDNFVETVSGEYSGVGIVVTTKDDQCVVVSAITGSPAYKAGIQSEDVIVEVNDQNVSQLSTESIVNLLRGEAGTKIVVGIQRQQKDEILRFEITRQTIELASVNYEMKENNIGYIKILTFDKDTNEEFKKALETLRDENAEALIIDLRDNPGGYIDTALGIAEDIVPEGPMMYFEKQGEIAETYSSETPQIDLPIAVLVNGGTASASEILAGAIQDTGAGTLIGTKTFGKGSAQQSLNLKNGGGMKLTVAHFLTPNKHKIHGIGITPDIILDIKKTDADEIINEVNQFAPMSEDEKPGLKDQGLNVYGAQQRLKFLGYTDIEVTGTLDENTFNAIKHYQKSHDLYDYGILDHTTQDLLNTEIIQYIENINTDQQLEKAMEILSK